MGGIRVKIPHFEENTMRRFVNSALVAAAASVALCVVAAPTEQDAKAAAAKDQQAQQDKSKEKLIVSAGQMPRVDGVPLAAATEPAAKPFKGLFFQSWVKDEDAKSKKGHDADAYR
jgi:hypothetical protein